MDRAALGRCVLGDKEALARLEHAVHPLVAARRRHFLQAHAGAPLVALDIPLLYEKDLQGEVDCVAVVSTSPELQRERVLARGWTPDKLNAVLALQVGVGVGGCMRRRSTHGTRVASALVADPLLLRLPSLLLLLPWSRCPTAASVSWPTTSSTRPRPWT